MTFIDVFNKFSLFCRGINGQCGSGVVLAVPQRNGAANETGRQMGRERDGQRLRERKWKRSQEFSHTNPFGRELRVNYSSFVFYLATSVWEWGSSKACQALIDAVWPEGFIQSWRWDQRRAGSEGVIVSGIGVGCWTATLYWVVRKNDTRWSYILKVKWSRGRLAALWFWFKLMGVSSVLCLDRTWDWKQLRLLDCLV